MAVAERRYEPQYESREKPFWLRPVSTAIPIDRELLAFLVLVLLAGLLRFWDLGSRMLHHDESLHAVYSYYLYIGKGYVHDPLMHGPFLFELNALVYFLLGVTDATARVAPALFGTILVGLPYLLRDKLGRTGAVVAAALIAVSPTILYYSRFIRHDIYQIFFMMLLVIATFRYFAERKTWCLYLAVVATSLAFSDKEDTYFLMAILLTFLLGVSRQDVLDVILKGKEALSPATDLLILLSTLILPMFAAAPYFFLQHSSETTIDVVFAISFAILFGTGMFVGLRWNRGVWTRSAVVFWGIFILLYTTFFSNPNGFSSGVFGSLRYWIDQEGVARGGQPWFYYLVLLPLYEFLSVGIALGGVVYWLRHRSLFTTFLMYWCLSSVVLWGWASEKMPWMVIELALPFCLLAAVTLGKLIEVTPWRTVLHQGGLLLALTLALTALVAATLVGQGSPFNAASPIVAQQQAFGWVALVALLVGFVYAVWHYWDKVGGKTGWKVVGLTVIALFVPFSVRAAWQVSYYHGDIPVEMLVYTQTAPDVGLVMQQINDIAYRSGEGVDKLQVAYDAGVSWPFEWYLRDYTSRAYIGTGNPPPNAPVVLVGYDNGRADQVKQLLGPNYVSQRYRLRWWFPEDYRTLSPSSIVQGLLSPTNRAKLWRFLLYRDPPDPLGSTDFVMFVRRDLAYGPWTAPQAKATTADQGLYAQKLRTVAATRVVSATGSGTVPFAEPKGIALGPNGDLYVADSQNNRIVEVNASGQFERAWGTKGTGNGQFNEPWGIAVNAHGDVYVADTWNHRVQMFDASGTFLRSWGSTPVGQPSTAPGQFYGPRAITIDASGNVYVTDTGNKRIEEFDSTGKYLTSIGAPGAGLGAFDEPVGIGVDRSGNIYVADTWNQRIEKFGPDLKPLLSWPVEGWDSQSVEGKPYLAVDGAGNVYVTDPENNKVIVFNSNGQLLADWGTLGTDTTSFHLPTGIAVDATGDVWISDSGNGRLMQFPPVH
ncbi:MAG TPA: flippase activity-associated protein Agl23 [Chloroflexota bacterium]|nr:flippase activity-associated protein Agl23 [Chloroflexota bacterium]